MGTQGFTGVTLCVVYDITGREDRAVLAQSGTGYNLHSIEFFQSSIDELMENMEESNCYIYWWNSYLLGEQ